jgi:hypothetical protein
MVWTHHGWRKLLAEHMPYYYIILLPYFVILNHITSGGGLDLGGSGRVWRGDGDVYADTVFSGCSLV